MGEWRKIARCSDGTLRGNDGMNGGVEHGAESFDSAGADAAETFGERVGAKEHDRASFGDGEWLANSASVGADEIDLQLADLFRRDADAGEFAKPSVDAVSGLSRGDQFVHDGARGLHSLGGDWRKRN